MAYVNFWKGPAADYVAETHGEGIYQCTDTGDTYIFGVKNSGSGGSTDDSLKFEAVTRSHPLYFNPNDTEEALSSLVFDPFNASDYFSANRILVMDDTNPEGTFGGGVNRYYIPVYTSMDAETDIVFHWITRLEDGAVYYRRLVIDEDGSSSFYQTRMDNQDVDLSNYVTQSDLADYATESDLTQGLAGKANTSDIPTLPSKMVESLNNSVSETSYTIYVAYRDNKNRPGTDPFVLQFATTTTPGIISAEDKAKLDSIKATSSNQSYQTGVSNIPLATYGIQLRQTGANGTMSFSGSLSDGQELHVIIKNVSSSAITITFPSSSSYISMSGDSMEIPGNGYLEVNVLRAGTYYYLRAAASLE